MSRGWVWLLGAVGTWMVLVAFGYLLWAASIALGLAS
jgi:hypothetical protein